MLTVLPNIILDGVNKGLRFAQVLTKEDLKFLLDNGNVGFMLYFLLVLLPVKQSNIFEKNRSKWYSILTLGPGNGKIVLILLEKVITFQLSFTTIYVWEPGL